MPRFLPFLLIAGLLAMNAKASAQPKTLVAVFAHADDEVMVMPLLARYAREGHTVHLVIATDGSYGMADHTDYAAGAELAAVRQEEARCSAAALGVEPPVFLGYTDGHVANDWPAIHGLHRDLDSLFRELRPGALLTWGPDGATGHPDHRWVSNIVTEVYQREGTAVKDLYYVSLPREVLDLSPAMRTHYTQQVLSGLHTTRPEFLNVRIEATAADLRATRTAIECYESQWKPEDMTGWFTILRAAEGTVHLRPFLGAGGKVRGLLWPKG